MKKSLSNFSADINTGREGKHFSMFTMKVDMSASSKNSIQYPIIKILHNFAAHSSQAVRAVTCRRTSRDDRKRNFLSKMNFKNINSPVM